MATNGNAAPVTTNASRLAPTASDRGSLDQQARQRLAACRTWKSYIELDIKECYFFTAPNRQRQISSAVMPSQARKIGRAHV